MCSTPGACSASSHAAGSTHFEYTLSSMTKPDLSFCTNAMSFCESKKMTFPSATPFNSGRRRSSSTSFLSVFVFAHPVSFSPSANHVFNTRSVSFTTDASSSRPLFFPLAITGGDDGDADAMCVTWRGLCGGPGFPVTWQSRTTLESLVRFAFICSKENPK